MGLRGPLWPAGLSSRLGAGGVNDAGGVNGVRAWRVNVNTIASLSATEKK